MARDETLYMPATDAKSPAASRQPETKAAAAQPRRATLYRMVMDDGCWIWATRHEDHALAHRE
jgi:hypothetical protein